MKSTISLGILQNPQLNGVGCGSGATAWPLAKQTHMHSLAHHTHVALANTARWASACVHFYLIAGVCSRTRTARLFDVCNGYMAPRVYRDFDSMDCLHFIVLWSVYVCEAYAHCTARCTLHARNRAEQASRRAPTPCKIACTLNAYCIISVAWGLATYLSLGLWV